MVSLLRGKGFYKKSVVIFLGLAVFGLSGNHVVIHAGVPETVLQEVRDSLGEAAEEASDAEETRSGVAQGESYTIGTASNATQEVPSVIGTASNASVEASQVPVEKKNTRGFAVREEWEGGPCDPDALACTEWLLEFLETTARKGKVIFGHQNEYDPYHTVLRTGSRSDVEDLTGDISGLAGYDTLDLTGYYINSPTQEDSMAFYVKTSMDAARRGALLTLVSHMPNFGSDNISMKNGQYDFHNCLIEDARDAQGNCAEECLPGGVYNEIFNAYLDMIAEYGLQMQKKQIPVQFRPFHEGNGSWFWWGGDNTNPETYIALFRYTVDYLIGKGVHNFLYVYSPNGPFDSEDDYLERYPGDAYVDVMAVDYYNAGYSEWPHEYKEDFFYILEETCQIVDEVASAHGKIPAISETGIWVMKEDYSGDSGLLESGNPMDGHAWYTRVGEIARQNHMPYYLVWLNSGIDNFHVPFKYGDSQYHEMADDFIDFYNEPFSLFAGDLHFYKGSGSGGNHSGGNSSRPGGSSSGSSGDSSGSNDSSYGALPAYVVTGTWNQEADGSWRFLSSAGQVYAGRWAAVYNPYANRAAGQPAFDWFYFNAAGYMVTGWLTDMDGERYYLNPLSDGTRGRMLTGWVWIPDSSGTEYCYYLNPVSDGTRGRMFKDTVVEGSAVNSLGQWTVDGEVQSRNSSDNP